MTAGESLTTFSLAFYNMNNLYPTSYDGNPNPKPIYFVAGTPFLMVKNASSSTNTMSFTINYSDINHPDLNTPDHSKPTSISVNGYFKDPITEQTSQVDPLCVQRFSLPTLTPTLTPTTPPGQPTNTPVPPTSTPGSGPTVTPISVPCGTKSCDNNSNPCRNDYVCVQANDGSNYCASPDFVTACKASPSLDSCCTSPGGPSATPTTVLLANVTSAPAKTVPSAGTTPWGVFGIIGTIIMAGLLL